MTIMQRALIRKIKRTPLFRPKVEVVEDSLHEEWREKEMTKSTETREIVRGLYLAVDSTKPRLRIEREELRTFICGYENCKNDKTIRCKERELSQMGIIIGSFKKNGKIITELDTEAMRNVIGIRRTPAVSAGACVCATVKEADI